MISTLAYNMDDLKAEVGSHQGYGMGTTRGDSAWTTFQDNRITLFVKEGLNQFYYPAADEAGAVHSWSFLQPRVSLTLASGANTLVLPPDFGGFEGPLTVSVDGESRFQVIRLTGEAEVRKQFNSLPDTTGRPLLAAVRPLKDNTEGQRFELYVWPTADAAYTVDGTAYIHPNYLTAASPWVYGGPEHASTVLMSCLAAAEQIEDNEVGPKARLFQERLRTSLAMDRRLKPAHLGYNGDRSDEMDRYHGYMQSFPKVTYNGVLYQ